MSDKTTLLPPNATEQERAIEQTTARLEDVPIGIRDLWNPDTCPQELLPWLAWSFSLDAWKSYWPEEVKRARIKQAVAIQRKKGTSQSVRDVVASFGGGLSLKEWWQTQPKGTPHTFEVVLTLGSGAPTTAEYQQDVIDAITQTKPVRSHFTFVLGITALGGIGFQSILRTMTHRRLQAVEAPYTGGLGLDGYARPMNHLRLTATEAI
ncbi:phage tail protein I [Thiomicrorhabdus sp. Kp2]|uniref:phage tail protein I n=1 Tax=Thiomicrorhabdus sp. Kp2 TaxID=1123518 RepID=UPI000411D0EB|nr:phage tail protein I [Thiomicrorhabdus sp. Kp2]